MKKINIYYDRFASLTKEFSYYLIMLHEDVFDNYKLIPVKDNRLTINERIYLTKITFRYDDLWVMTHLIPFASDMLLPWVKENLSSLMTTLNESAIRFIFNRLKDIDHLGFLKHMSSCKYRYRNGSIPIFMEQYKDKLVNINEEIIEPIIKRKDMVYNQVNHNTIKSYIEICLLHSIKIKVPLLRKLLWRTRGKTDTSIVVLKYINDNNIIFRFDTVDKSFVEKY